VLINKLLPRSHGHGECGERRGSVTETHTITKDYDPRTGTKRINRYEMLETIGRGVHGKVKIARDTDTEETVAIKIVKRESRRRLGRGDPRDAELKIRREIAIMKKCVHPNVVALREVMDDPNSHKIYLGSLTDDEANLVLEYMAGGQLKWRDEDNNPLLNIEQIRQIIRDTVLGLEYLHFQGIIHRDIKPANLLLDENQHVKISDFGVSHLAKVDEETGELLTEGDLELSKTAGSPAFFAPELCHTSADTKRSSITKAIDIWALGITLYCLLFGMTPFPETGHEFQLFNMICNDPIPIPPPEFEDADVDDEVKDLLKRLLIKDPETRITLEEIKHHPFILRNLPDPGRWLEETDPRHAGLRLEVTPEEVSSAVSLSQRFKHHLYKLQSSLSSLTGLRRRVAKSEKRSTSVSTLEPSSPDSHFNSRRGSQISLESLDNRHSSNTSTKSPPQQLSRVGSSATKITAPLPPRTATHPAPLRPSKSLRSPSRGRSTTDYHTDSRGPSIPRSRAISDLSANLNGTYLLDHYDYLNPHLPQDEEEDEEEGQLCIDFGRRRQLQGQHKLSDEEK
jgi:serine/threonine protein kinase